MGIKQAFISWMSRPKVVHRLPGRLRVQIAALKRVPQDGQHIGQQLAKLFCLPQGIESVDVGYSTGNLLIRYDTEVISEDEVIRCIEGLWRMVVANFDRLTAVSKEDLPVVTERLRQFLDEQVWRDIMENKEVSIPEDIWP